MKEIQKRQEGRELSLDPKGDFFDLTNFWSNRWPGFAEKSWPACNISETETSYLMELVAPGFIKDNFKIDVSENVLTISAESKEESAEEKKDYSRREYSFNSFARSFRLPDNAQDDKITASYKDGILHITIPKADREVKATKHIDIAA